MVWAKYLLLPTLLAGCVGPQPRLEPLRESAWQLSRLHGQSVSSAMPPTLGFAAGRAYGSDGCNRYTGDYTAKGERFALAENTASTRMACPEAVMVLADSFMQALHRARKFQVLGGELVLRDAEGLELLILTQEPAP